ncbi:MAG: N-acetylmannosamine-6-phosphate 2-epimerase [Anaerolineaceae bacterium]|nr:N-acetylmannosamine-6-phosphate 2-epimerase [Anaerolineaceae bacterium]
MNLKSILDTIHGKLIVSVQPAAYHAELDPMNDARVMAAMAQAVVQGGAAAIRANSPEHIRAMREVIDLPIIGLYKFDLPGFEVRITPTLAHAEALAEAGADVIALDATARPHPEGLNAAELINLVKETTGLPVMADIATLREGLAAAKAGADLLSTTLSGYTSDSPQGNGPDFELVQQLVRAAEIPVIAEGKIATPQQAAEMLRLGAWAVVVGSAITRPKNITEAFIKGMRHE